MSKPLIKRIITAGPLVQMAVYPAASPRDGPKTRQGKRALSSMAQQRMNAKYAWRRKNMNGKDLRKDLTTEEMLEIEIRLLKEAAARYGGLIEREKMRNRAAAKKARAAFLLTREDEHRNERAHAVGGSEGYGGCEDECSGSNGQCR